VDLRRSRTPDWWHVVLERDGDGWNEAESAAVGSFERWVKWMWASRPASVRMCWIQLAWV